ncbi:GNAT family N-acetyltransferase [Kineosporia succinea]|uniref:GNAT superfamily N-acetyltransferase n=1 Tax=Kineosporia succinea TaxID=84632 RepID=A0ABT9P376_9ACTN|nr:GNAT family N-acetyltransferase [Kineosporia succinea]MDP9827137.1 GNAT superfamily N-acetyltransferase [Kineosporia succinea]
MSNSPVTDLLFRDVPFDGPEATVLIAEVQQEYVVRYGGPDSTPVDPNEFAPPSGLFTIAEAGGELAGCVGLRANPAEGEGAVEMKRLYVRAPFRRQGLARRLLASAELRAMALGYSRLILETGTKQPEAVALYRSAGYQSHPGFGIYANEAGSLYFAKDLGV